MKEIYMIFEDVPYREDGNYGVEARCCLILDSSPILMKQKNTPKN